LGSTAGGVTGTGAYGGLQAPDIVGNLRVDQAWGSAQVMGAGHLVNAVYYNTGSNNVFGTIPTFEQSGGPDNKWGFVVGAGLKLNFPQIGPGDYFQAEVNYTEGALRYLVTAAGGGNYQIDHGADVGYGILADGVYAGSPVGTHAPSPAGTMVGGTQTGINLTTGWSVNASYEHFWNPRWRTSLYGAYMAVSYNDQANAILCAAQGDAANGPVRGGGYGDFGADLTANAGCNNNWNFWNIGSRTQWNVTKDFYLGVDVLYGKLHSATTSSGFVGENTVAANTITAFTSGVTGTGAANNGGLRPISDTDIWSIRFRVHRDFYP
jgi:hypothetical protein